MRTMFVHRSIARGTRAFALAGVLALTACGTANEPMGLPAQEKRAPAPGVEAVFSQVNASGMNGTARFVDRGGVTHVFIVVNNGPPSPFSIAIHERGNCSSPNAFSAGQPWAPPGWSTPAARMFPSIVLNTNGTGDMTVRLRGLALSGPDSLQGRAVLVHAGPVIGEDSRPGVPNNVVLCGVIGPVRSFFDNFAN